MAIITKLYLSSFLSAHPQSAIKMPRLHKDPDWMQKQTNLTAKFAIWV